MFAEYELTRSAILNDPLIRQVMRADRVSSAELENLMTEVAARLDPYARQAYRKDRRC